jgi:hypothetical protein
MMIQVIWVAMAISYLVLAIAGYWTSGMLTHFWSQVIVRWSPEILRNLIGAYPTRKWKGTFGPVGFVLAAIFAMMVFLLMILFFILLFIVLSPLAVYQILRRIVGGGKPPGPQRPAPAVEMRVAS